MASVTCSSMSAQTILLFLLEFMVYHQHVFLNPQLIFQRLFQFSVLLKYACPQRALISPKLSEVEFVFALHLRATDNISPTLSSHLKSKCY